MRRRSIKLCTSLSYSLLTLIASRPSPSLPAHCPILTSHLRQHAAGSAAQTRAGRTYCEPLESMIYA